MKRYDMDCDCPDCRYCGMFMDKCNDGDYVKYEDYAELKAERDAYREALKEITKAYSPSPVKTYQRMEDIAKQALEAEK
jgi:hypothetical protein